MSEALISRLEAIFRLNKEIERRQIMSKKFGQKVKELRIKRGMSQDELAKALGYQNRSSINKIELDIRDIPRSKVAALAEALGIDPLVFIYDDPKQIIMSDEPVGTWKYERDENAILFMKDRWRCPICDSWQTYGQPKHCPDCGARLERKETNNDAKRT